MLTQISHIAHRVQLTMDLNRYIVDVTGRYEYDEVYNSKPIIEYFRAIENDGKQSIDEVSFNNNIGINNNNDNSNIVIFIHGFNFQQTDAIRVFNIMMNKIASVSKDANRKFICVLWNSSANDKGELIESKSRFIDKCVPGGNMIKSAARFIGEHFPGGNIIGSAARFIGERAPALGAAGDETRKFFNSGFILDRYIEDLERITNSFKGISWLLNDIAQSNKKIHLIGHSMGCLAVLNCLSFMCHDNTTLKCPYHEGPVPDVYFQKSERIVKSIRNVFLIAPDASTSLFRLFVLSNMPTLTGLDKLVIYCSDNDIAIIISKLIRVHNYRIGSPEDANTVLRDILNELGAENLGYINKIQILNVTGLSAVNDVVAVVPLSLWSSDYPMSHNYYTKDSVCYDIGNVIYGNRRPNVVLH